MFHKIFHCIDPHDVTQYLDRTYLTVDWKQDHALCLTSDRLRCSGPLTNVESVSAETACLSRETYREKCLSLRRFTCDISNWLNLLDFTTRARHAEREAIDRWWFLAKQLVAPPLNDSEVAKAHNTTLAAGCTRGTIPVAPQTLSSPSCVQ